MAGRKGKAPTGADGGVVDEVVAGVRAREAASARGRRGGVLAREMRVGRRRRAEAAPDAYDPAAVGAPAAVVAPTRPEPDDPDDMLATAALALGGGSSQRVDFHGMMAEGRFEGGTIRAVVAANGQTTVELYKGNMFAGRETVRRQSQLEAVVARLRDRWTFEEPV